MSALTYLFINYLFYHIFYDTFVPDLIKLYTAKLL